MSSNPTADLAATSALERRQELYSLLGDLPARDRRLTATLINRSVYHEPAPGYVVETLLLDLNGQEAVPAYFAKPLAAPKPLPCVLYNHAHGGDYALGKDELLHGRAALQQPPYVAALTAQGYAVLCIDHWCFGERRGRSESAIFKQMLWEGRVLWGMMIYDSLRAVDYLTTRDDVDAGRLATLGLSMGSTMAWWLAALDTRIAACVDLCCLTDFQAIIASQQLDQHGVYYYVPGLLKRFTTAQINALIAPRPHLSLAGDYDPLTPAAGLTAVDSALRQVYTEMDAADAWQLLRYPIGHYETAAMRQAVLAWLQRWLG